MHTLPFVRPDHTAGVILGAHAWPHFSGLNGGKAFCNSAAAIRRYMIDPLGIGLASEGLLDLFDSEASADEQLLKIGEFLSGWIKRTGGRAAALTDLFLYYVGHGDFIGTSTEFLMLVRASRPRREMTAIPARALASVLRDEAPFVRQLVILDCCWSGAAHRIWQSGTAPDVAARSAAELMPNNGTVLLCSSSENMPSMAPQGATQTMFTGALIEVLQAGDPNVHGNLSPRQVRDLAFDAMRKRWGADAVRPVVYAIERGSGDLSDMPLFPNRAEQDVTESENASKRTSEKLTFRTRRQLLTVGIPIVAGTAICSAAFVIALPKMFGDKPAAHDPNSIDAEDSGEASTSEDSGEALTSEKNIRNAVAWFKERFGAQMAKRITNTPLTPSFIAALAVSESYFLWGKPLPPMATADLLELCVGDTIDAPLRHAFPKTKADLLAAPYGPEMFKIARAALVRTGAYNPLLAKITNGNPNKFAHAFGVFSHDLQFFISDPDFFLQKQWRDFDKCLERAVPILLNAVKRVYGDSKATLSEDELVYVGIAWNTGTVNLGKGFKQGFYNGQNFYGESLATYLHIAATVPDNPAAVIPATSQSNAAPPDRL